MKLLATHFPQAYFGHGHSLNAKFFSGLYVRQIQYIMFSAVSRICVCGHNF